MEGKEMKELLFCIENQEETQVRFSELEEHNIRETDMNTHMDADIANCHQWSNRDAFTETPMKYTGIVADINSQTDLLLTNREIIDCQILKEFSDWLAEHYDANWSLTKMVKEGVGFHKHSIPHFLNQIQLKIFSEKDGLEKIIAKPLICSAQEGNVQSDFLFQNNITGCSGKKLFENYYSKTIVLKKAPEGVNIADVLGNQVYERMITERGFYTTDLDLLKRISIDMSTNPNEWNGLNYLNSTDTFNLESMLHRLFLLQPSGWGKEYKPFIEFLNVLKKNWFKPIPELLKDLNQYGVDVDDFINLERIVTGELAPLLSDVNFLQKEIFGENKYDISRFVTMTSRAFLPTVVYQLEEYGLPRMISKKIHKCRLIDFYNEDLSIYKTLERFNEIGMKRVISIPHLSGFDKYIIENFYNGISMLPE